MNQVEAESQALRLVREPVHAEDRARANFYSLIAHLFAAAPRDTLLAHLAQADEIDADTEFAAAWNALCAAAQACDAEAAAHEYEALFGGVSRPRVMLYGSFYLAGFMMEKPLAALRVALAELGLARQNGASEPEDHFAAICEVMHILILDDALSQSERDARQARFFVQQFGPWYAQAMDAVAADEIANFYRRAARFARAFLDLEVQAFEIEA